MKLDVNNFDLDDLEELPPRQKLIKKKTKDYEAEKEAKSKKNDNYRKERKKEE